MTNKDFWVQFEEAPSFSNDIKSNNSEYWDQFESIDFAENSENNIYDKELFNKKLNEYLNYDGAVIENRKPYIHRPVGNTSISNYDPKNKLYNPYDPVGNFLQGLKRIAELPSKAFKETSNQIETADLEIKEMNNQILGRGFSEDDKKRLDYLNNNVSKSVTETIEKPAYKHKDPWTVLGALEKFPYSAKYAYAAALKQLPILYNIGKESLIGGIGGAGIGAGIALIGGQLGPQAATPEEVITVPGGASIGFIWGSRIGAAKKTFEIEAGLARNELKQINKEIINEGGKPLSNEEINGLSIAVGGVNAGLELISLKTMLKTVPGGNEILKKLEQKQLKELAKDKTIREQLSKVIKDYSNAVLTESTTEAAQELTNIVAGRIARELGGLENNPLKEEVSRIIDATKEAFAATLFLGGVGSIAQTAKIHALQGINEQEALEKAKNMSFDERHEFVNDNQDVLLNDIKNIPSVRDLEKNIKKNEQAMQASDKIFNDLKSANIDDEQANSLSQLMGIAYANIAEGDTQGRNALDIYNNYNVTIKGGISKDVVSDTVSTSDIETEAFNQSAMYRSPKENFTDFYNQVFEKETEAKKNNSKIQKSYFDFTDENVSVRIPHDTIIHDDNKHKLTSEEWQEILNNLSEPADVAFSNKPRFNGQPVLLKIVGNNTYGVVVETFKNKQPIITTAFMDTEVNIDNWLNNNKKEASRARNTSAVTTKGLLPSSASTNIINHIKENLKPRKNTYFQSAPPINSNAFKNWFGDSKVVDESGKPLVVYHGTAANFNIFEANNASTDYDFPEGMYFSSSKEIAKTYGDYKHTKPMELYLKIKNPLILNANEKTYNAFYSELYSSVKNIDKNTYDGIIIKNIRDDWSQNDEGGEIATTYIVFNPEQIKSVNNRGSFDVNNPDIYYQSAAMKKSEFDNFSDFYNSVLNNKNPKDKKQFNYLTNDGLNIRIPHDTINHAQKKHKLTVKEWENLLNNIDNVSQANISKQKSSYDGKSVLLKIKTNDNVYGVVLETFKKNNPLISTAFIDTEKSINNWIKNEAVPSGTKTTFLDISLNNIIKDIQPDFKPKIIKSTFYQDNAQKEWQEQGTESRHFKNWFKNSKVVNEDNSPRVVYHGSVDTFSIFDKDRAEVTGDMGAGFYFTSSNQDALNNYEGGGPDFEQKVSLYAEKIMNEENIEAYNTAENVARERLMGKPSKLDIYLSMQNPAYVGGKNKTYLFAREEYDTSDIVQEDYDSKEDYYNAIDEDLYSQFESTLYRIESAISDLLDYNDTQKVLQVVNEGFYDNGITVEELKNKLNQEYLEDYNTGKLVSNEVLRRIIEAQGYDGIIDETVSNKFNMGLSSDTIHYIVFNPEQIKSVNNQGTFNINNSNIYYQPAYHGSPYKFNNFSLDKIGTGEGAQAHGWGLYFAENKEVSERYRKNLSGDIKISYKGEQYDIEENFGNALYKIKKYGKDKAIEFYKNKEKEFRAEAKTSSNPRWWKHEADIFKIYADEVKDINENDIEILEGQLFQVDIPENDVLLDENKIFKAQPETVKQVIKNIVSKIVTEKNLNTLGEKLYQASSRLRQTLKDNNYQETKQVYNLRLKYQNLQNQYDLLSIIQEESKYYYNGKKIYETLSAYFNSDKKTSEELNKQGVKGIVYNGDIDGRCYVIFDDKAISVLETFYQDYVYNQITGEKVEIEINKDIKVNKIEPQKISSKLPFKISKKTKENKINLFNVLGLDNQNITAINKNTNEKVNINKNTIEKSISNKSVNDIAYKDFCLILYNVKDLFSNSQKILSHKDTKKNTKIKVSRYANIASIEGNNYLLEFVVKNNGTVQLYSVNTLNNKAVSANVSANALTPDTAYNRHRENASNKNSMQHDVVNYSIANIIDIFKTKLINKYNNDIKKNGKNSDFINTVEYEQDEHRGSISFYKDEEGNIRKTLIDLVSGKADKSTAAHEFAHLFLQTLIIEADTNLKAREMLLEVNKAFGYNGKEYTTDFHEKFARSFEAYLASGKAPTYKLKQVFEKFKKWLKDIYLSIKYNTDIVLSPEAEQVFNKIFSNEENLEELNKKKADILKKAKEFGQVRYKPTEEQLRYKNIAYDILATGLRRNPNWLKSVLESGSNTRAMQKKRERIEFDLRKIQDPYSSGSGMLPEWREFFTDPGVSYENNIAGADYELAQQAYDVIINRLWERTNEEYYELQQVENEYEYILKEFKNAKNTDDRTTVLIAYYDWLESIDEIAQEQYGEKWVHDTNEIERFEQLNKFEQAKEILIKNSDLLKNSNGITEYKNVVQAVLKQLNFLTAFERNKILGVVSEITSTEELKNNINEIMDFAETLQDVTARKNISENIQKELMATKNIRKNGKTYGKYDYSTNKLFNKLREVNKLNREDAEAEYTTLLEEFEAMSEEQKESLSFEDKLYKKFVTYKAHGNVYISSDFLSSLYQDIIFAKMQGRLSKNSADFESRLNNNAAIDKVLDRLEKKTPAKDLTKFYTKFANLESFINLFLDKKFVDEYSLLFEETQVQAKSYLEKQTVLKEMSKILNVKPFFIDDEIFKKLNEKYIFKDYSLKRVRDIELNKMQLIEAYIYSKNPIIKQRLINMFSEGGYDRIMSLLNSDDIKIGDLLQRTAEKYYKPVNQVYIKKYGIDMPKAKNYFPVAADVVQELDLFNQYTEQSTAPKFFKTRTSSVFVPIKLSNPVQTLFTHIEKANNLIILEEKLGKLNRVFKDRTVKQFISDLYGEEAYNGFIKQISDCSYTKKAEILGAVDSMINKLVNNVIVSTISLKPKIMATQLVSVINFSDKMPSALWFGGFLKALSNPGATIKFMMKNEYLQQRFGEGAQNEALARIVKASDFHKSKKFIDFFSLNVKLGDIGAIIFGGKPYVDYLMQHKKMSKEEAFKEFVLEVNRAQQAATTSSLADYQKSKNPIFRLYYAFQNTTNQYFRKTADAIISKANGDISNSEMIKTILIYTVFNNFLYRIVANPYVWILGFAAGDWGDFTKEVVNSIFDLNSQALIGIGNIYQAILNAILDKPFYLTAKGLDKIPFDIHKLITESKEGLENIKLDTWLNAIGDIIDTSTGAPASTIINTGSIPANISDGQIGTAILKILGYSDYQSKKAFDIDIED